MTNDSEAKAKTIQLFRWQLALIVVAAIALGAVGYWRAYGNPCVERDVNGDCRLYQSQVQSDESAARDAGYDEGFADGFSAQLDPCDYWTKKYTEDIALWSVMLKPAPNATPDIVNETFKNLHDEAVKNLAEAQKKYCATPTPESP